MIAQDVIDNVVQFVEAADLGEGIAAKLREKWPEIHFTYCSDDDVTAAKPLREHDHFNIYLVASGEGCISFTSHPERATGIVVAEIETWEDF